MSEFLDLKKQIEEYKCPICSGNGIITDAECGDIYFNTWKCIECGGTGLKTQIVIIERK